MREGNAAWQALKHDEADQEITAPSQYTAQWRARHRAQGLCVECVQRAEPGKRYCSAHLRALVERMQRYRARRRSP